MSNRLLLASLFLAAVMNFAGCGSHKNALKTAPKTMPDQSQIIDNAGSDEGIENGSNEDYSDQNSPLELLTVHFEYDRYDLTREALDVLNANAEALSKHPAAVIKIEGHCDERGTEEYNLALGEKRAQAVRGYLLKYGINSGKISIISYGEMMPVDKNHGESAWRKNRRADFVVQSE